jgi:hypothetical protein
MLANGLQFKSLKEVESILSMSDNEYVKAVEADIVIIEDSMSTTSSSSSPLDSDVSLIPGSLLTDLPTDQVTENVVVGQDGSAGRNLREKRRIDYHNLSRYGSCFSVHGDDDELVTPKTYREALNGELSDLWLEAITNELNSINSYDTWKIHYDDVPPENILTTKWVFAIKKDSHGKFLKCKARLVSRGFQQEEGRDFNEIFSPVVKTESIRFLLALEKEQC